MKHEYTKLQAAIAEHKALTADYWAARWQDEVDARNRQYNELECTRAIADKALTELAKTKENGLSQLRPLAEAGAVPEGCVRYYTYKKNGEWTTKSKYRAMQDTHYIDTRLPEPEPLVTKPISPPTWTPAVGDVVTINDGGPAFPITENGLQGYNGMSLRDWFAGQALAMLADPDFNHSPEDTARLVYRIADAMLAGREVKP